MKIGDRICWACGDMNSGAKVLREGTITKVGKEVIWVDGFHRPEDCIYSHWVWPIAAKVRLAEALEERYRLRTVYEDSMRLIHELRNAVARGEITY